MGFSYGCRPAPNTHFMPNAVNFNRTLFTVTGSTYNVPYSGNTIMGGSFNRCGNYGSIFNRSFNPMNRGCQCGGNFGGFGNPFGNFRGNFGGFGNPFGNFGGSFGGFGNPFGNFGGNFGGFRFPFF